MNPNDRQAIAGQVEEYLTAIDGEIRLPQAAIARLEGLALELRANQEGMRPELASIRQASRPNSGLRRLAEDEAREHHDEERVLNPMLAVAQSQALGWQHEAGAAAEASRRSLLPVRNLLESGEAALQALRAANNQARAVEAHVNSAIDRIETLNDLLRAIARRQS